MPSSSHVDWRRASPWSAQFDEARACQRLDDELEKLVWHLRRHAVSLEKTLRCRVLRWCTKFDAEKDSPALVWKKGRNQHARALLLGLRSGRLVAPFDAGPPDEPLGAGVSSSCAAAVGLHERAQQRRPEEGEAKKEKKQRRPPLVPGTASLRLAPPLLLPLISEGGGGDEGEEAASSSYARAALPSRVELAASLGSARERIAELEWRLGEKERSAKAKAWARGVAAARVSAASLPSFEEEEGEEEERRRAAHPAAAAHLRTAACVIASPLPPKRAAAAAAAAGTTPLPPMSPLLRRPKASAAAPVTLSKTPQRKLQQKELIPSLSLEELSRRISALAPQEQ